MNTCRECIHHTPPAILDAGHPCITCDGDRVVVNGSNFKTKPLQVQATWVRPTWTEYFLQIAALAATRSKDRSTKVGAVIVDSSRAVVSTGYNGFPVGIDDDIKERHERPTKYLYTCHAEENAILSAARRGVSVDGCTLYCTHQPCSRCARGIVQAGISKVVFPYGSMIPTMADDLSVGLEILNEADVQVICHGMDEHEADPDPYENTKAHDVTEVHAADKEERQPMAVFFLSRFIVVIADGYYITSGPIIPFIGTTKIEKALRFSSESEAREAADEYEKRTKTKVERISPA